MKSINKTKQEYFPITSVSRADLEEIGFDTTNVDDSTMAELASKMADAYCEIVFWIDLEILADYLKIKKHKKSKLKKL